MNLSTAPSAAGLTPELAAFHALCEEVLALVSGENQALSGNADYRPVEFNQARKGLIPKLESALIKLKLQRQGTRNASRSEEATKLLQAIQCLLMKVLLLDRDNQRALLRRGLVPAAHLPPAAAQQPHYVAGLYRRHLGNQGSAG